MYIQWIWGSKKLSNLSQHKKICFCFKIFFVLFFCQEQINKMTLPYCQIPTDQFSNVTFVFHMQEKLIIIKMVQSRWLIFQLEQWSLTYFSNIHWNATCIESSLFLGFNTSWFYLNPACKKFKLITFLLNSKTVSNLNLPSFPENLSEIYQGLLF